MNQTVTNYIDTSYKTWEKEENILFNIAMGRGKTYFIVNVLGKYADKDNKKILYLCNRSNLSTQVFGALKNTGVKSIVIKTYQSMQNDIQDKSVSEYFDYIICDECHYFYTDSWNDRTDIMLDWITKQKSIRLFMSATGGLVFNYLRRTKSECREYTLKPDYSYIKKIIFYDNDLYIDRVLDDVVDNIVDDEKVIYFSRKTPNAYELYIKYKCYASFVCSSYTKHKEYVKYIDKNAIDDSGNLKSQVTCTTSVMDNGIDIKDSQLKHVIIDFEDIIQLIQAIGRKRVGKIENNNFTLSDEDSITIYIKNWSKGELTRFINLKSATIKEAEKVLKKDKKYLKELTNRRGKIINSCLYIDYLENCLKINEFRYLGLIYEINRLTWAKGIGFDQYILGFLGESFKGAVEYINLKQEKIENDLEQLVIYLKNLIGKKLYKEEKEELINMVNYKVNGRQVKSPKKISENLQKLGLEYIIESRKSNTKRFWIVSATNK